MSTPRGFGASVVFEHDVLPDSSDEDGAETDSSPVGADLRVDPGLVQRSRQTTLEEGSSSSREPAGERSAGLELFSSQSGGGQVVRPLKQASDRDVVFASEADDAEEALFQKFCASLVSPVDPNAADDRLLDDDVEFDYWKAYFESKEPNEEFRADTGARISSEELFQLVAEDGPKSSLTKEPMAPGPVHISTGFQSRTCSGMPERRPRSRRGVHSAEEHSLDRNRLFQLLKFKLLKPEQEHELSKQIHIHVQLLLHVLLISSQRRANIHITPDDVVRRQRAREAAWLMLDDLRRKRDVARDYRRILGGVEDTFFDAPPLDLLGEVEVLVVRPALSSPDGLITVAEAKNAYNVLRARSNVLLPEYSMSCGVDIDSNPVLLQGLDAGPRAAPSWTPPEDALLERCLARHGVMWQEHFDDFLPHRSLEECVSRYRQLTRRDAPENPVKILKLKAQDPLSVEEIERLRQGVMMYGECWDAIQAFLLPGRDKVLLERVWKRLSLRARKELRRRRRRRKASLTSEWSALPREMSTMNGEMEHFTHKTILSNESDFRDRDESGQQKDTQMPFSHQEDRELLLLMRQHLGSMDEASIFELIAEKMKMKRTPEAYRERARNLISLL